MEGLWSVAFSTQIGAGYGVVFFTSEITFVGGDSGFYWTGSFSTMNGRANIKLEGHSHSGRPAPSVLGMTVKDFTLDLQGEIPASPGVGSSFKVSGSGGLVATLTRRPNP
jgi:hypothetical protein